MNDQFKMKFKYYKSNNPKPSMEKVLSVDRLTNLIVQSSSITDVEDNRVYILGLEKMSMWKLYSFVRHPGLFLIRNPFTAAGQKYWIRRCLEDYPKKPNKTNIDYELILQDWWKTCYETGHCNSQLQKKLRWTTLGYHHNWDTKIYSEENRTTFPEDLAELSHVVAQYLGYNDFKAEAAIVNYYHMDSTLSPHTDHSEVNLNAPLFSFSFGQSAIFLIGDKDKSVEPSAILINSGDIVVMSKAARVCYHAVPKILNAPCTPWHQDGDKVFDYITTSHFKYISNPEEIITFLKGNTAWSRYEAYVNESRINMNVRQVLNENESILANVFNDDR